MDENVHIAPDPANVANAAHVNASMPAPAGNIVTRDGAQPVDAADLLGDMEAGIRDKLMKMSDEFGADFTRLHTTWIDMPDEIKAHPMYKSLGERISSVEALLNTLIHTAASFPMPVEAPHVPHGAL
jgi:hypothetical protein